MFPYNQLPATSSITSSVGKILIDAQSRAGTNSEAGSEVASEAAKMVFGGGLRSALSNPANSPFTNIKQSANPRASAKSRASVKFADEEGKPESESGRDEQDKPRLVDEATEMDGPGDGEEKKVKNTRKHSNRNRQSDEMLDISADLQTEVGSNIDIYSDDDDDIDDSGNEADIDTISDGLTLPPLSRMTNHIPTKEEMQREFARKLSERLVQSAMLAGAKDNITAMVILLPGCGISN